MITKIFQGGVGMRWPASLKNTTNEVVTSYNNRVYRIKSVHFDMDPNSHFDMRRKGDKDLKISHLDFWNFMPKSSIHWLFLVSRVLKPLTSLMCFKGVNEFCGSFVSQNLRGYHQLTLPYFCAMKDVNLVIHLEKKRELWRSEKKIPFTFPQTAFKNPRWLWCFLEIPTSFQQPVLQWGRSPATSAMRFMAVPEALLQSRGEI